ncbi:MAG: hypothetical protein WBG16_26160, partial [Bradyrhizobium sp.]|uniref:hypothetical protein n=1 Tax=Bradyrhizobium sp. TaxID=376 RepID=UPI003C765423
CDEIVGDAGFRRGRALKTALWLWLYPLVMPGLEPGIHLLRDSDGLPGHRQAEATPFFERLCPAMTAYEA